MISAGFDAAAEDPLGHLELTPAIYRYMTDRLVDIAERFSDGRIISVLEGGYDLDALGRCAAAHVEGLLVD